MLFRHCGCRTLRVRTRSRRTGAADGRDATIGAPCDGHLRIGLAPFASVETPRPTVTLSMTVMKGTSLIEPAEPMLQGIETTRFTAEQWKNRAMYEEACKLSAERALARAMDLLGEALFAAAHVRPDPVDDLTADPRVRPLNLAAPPNA